MGYNRYSNNYSVGRFHMAGSGPVPKRLHLSSWAANSGPTPTRPSSAIQNQYQLTDNISWTKGNHSFKFGFDGWKQISPQSFTQRARGDYEWSTSPTTCLITTRTTSRSARWATRPITATGSSRPLCATIAGRSGPT